MASSTSSSPAGAESTPSAQVSAAPPPYLWLPSRRGRAGSAGLGVPGAVRRGGLPGLLPSWGCRAGLGRRAVGDPSSAGPGGPAARDWNCGPGQRREQVICPSPRASRGRREEGPRIWGFCFATFVSKKSAAQGSGRPHFFGLPIFGLLCSWLAPPTPCQAEPFLRTRPK